MLHAIELEPNYDLAHWLYAMSLAHRGRFDEAISEMDITLAINPDSLLYQRDRGRFLFYARRYDEAIVQLKRSVELDKNFATSYGWGFLAYEMKGDYAQAYEWFIKSQELLSPQNVELFQKAYETSDWKGVRQKRLELERLRPQRRRHSNFGQTYRHPAQCGENSAAV